jgi:cell division protein ZapB
MNQDESKTSYKEIEENSQKSSRTLLIILFLFVIATAVGVKFYLDSEKENEQLQLELDSTYSNLDSISSQLDSRIAEIKILGGDVTELQLIRKTLEEEKEQLKQSNNWAASQIKRYKDKVSGYEELLNLQDEKILKLEAINEQLLSENTDLKSEKNILNDSILDLRSRRSELANKVAIASQLKAENIQIFGLNSSGKERESEFRARQIEKLKVSFNLADNKVAQPEGKNIIVRVINPTGKALFDVATGSGSFMIEGKEMFYTAKQEILFDNTQQRLSFLYDRGQEYEEGIYKVELYADDYLIGKGTFTVK